MIQRVDDLLRALFETRIPLLAATGPVAKEQIGFGPPNSEWRGQVQNLGDARALNVYLVDLRDNRRLRSSERRSTVEPGGRVVRRRAPARLDCHYLVTAWSNATEDQDKTPEEHRLLHEVVTALVNAEPLVAADVFAPGSLPPGFPDALADAEIPVAVAPEEGFPKLAEWWGTMGYHVPWKPAVWLVVTVPVPYAVPPAGPMVTTTVSHFEFGDELLNLGGTVLDGDDPVPGAWIRLLAEPGSRLVRSGASDELGHFLFTGLAAGRYRFHAGAAGVGTGDRTIDVPSNTGEYDLHLA